MGWEISVWSRCFKVNLPQGCLYTRQGSMLVLLLEALIIHLSLSAVHVGRGGKEMQVLAFGCWIEHQHLLHFLLTENNMLS